MYFFPEKGFFWNSLQYPEFGALNLVKFPTFLLTLSDFLPSPDAISLMSL